jgi:hypothetical protein
MTTSGRADRESRLTESRSGAWGSSSADLMRVVRLLFDHSRAYARTIDGNCSPYTLCAIPMLLSSLRCLVVEHASYPPADAVTLRILTESNDFAKILDRYQIDAPLKLESALLQELRNEIIHPAHRPTGTADNWPDYLRVLKDRGLTQSTGRADSDYIFFSQLQSHRLFVWSWRVVRDLAETILRSDPRKSCVLINFLDNYEMRDVE